MKKFVSLLLTAVLLATTLTVFAVPASAEEEFTSDDYKYTVNGDGTATITMYTGNGGNVEIPAAFDGHTVTAIGGCAFENCGQLTAVTIPGSVVSIGGLAFDKCGQLTAVTIPGSVVSIGESAFVNCTGITTLTISDGVKSIGESAFQGCNKIANVTIPGTVGSIGESAFQNCIGITTLTISDGVKSIGARAFQGCDSLPKVTIPGTVTSIGLQAFDGCAHLVIHGLYGSAAEKYARENSVAFKGTGTCSHIYCFVCDSCNKSLTKSDLLKAWGNTATASTLSEGNLTVIVGVACLAVGLVGGLLIGKKKTKTALADGTDNTDEE